MIVNSHLLISQILYNYISKHMGLKLDRLAFAYGNINPDLNNKDINRSHTLVESLDIVNKYSEDLMSADISIKEFSRRLGVICHFGCDYFCLYHREGNEKKGLYEHLHYEVILHIKLLTLFLRGKIKLNDYEMNENSVEAIVLKIQNKYVLEHESLTRDITNALSAVLQMSKLIVYSCQVNYQQKKINILKEYQLREANICRHK